MTTYRDSGVDVDKGNEAVNRLKKHVENTHNQNVLKGIGAFAGAFDASSLKNMKDPVLLATTDGVGTKTLVAQALGKWEGVGQDIVNHCGNDLVCQGATPLFFLDYIASSNLDPHTVEEVVKGMSNACRELDCAILGGELAEMPQVYCEGSHDVVGTMIGVVDRAQMITGETIEAGDTLIAFPSSGLHTNGYTLARKVLTDLKKHGETLLKPHTSYTNLILKLHKEVGLKGVAHITGGGISGNLPRIFPKGLGAKIQKSTIKVPPIFTTIQEEGSITEEEMFTAFNMGVGMIVVTEKKNAKSVLSSAAGSYKVGEVTAQEGVRFE